MVDEALEGRGAYGVIVTWDFGGFDSIFTELAGILVSLSLSINTGSIKVDGVFGVNGVFRVDGVFCVFVKYAGCRNKDSCHAFLSMVKAIAFLLTGHLTHSGAA